MSRTSPASAPPSAWHMRARIVAGSPLMARTRSSSDANPGRQSPASVESSGTAMSTNSRAVPSARRSQSSSSGTVPPLELPADELDEEEELFADDEPLDEEAPPLLDDGLLLLLS